MLGVRGQGPQPRTMLAGVAGSAYAPRMAIAIRDKIREKAAPHLEPGEQVQAVFSAQTFSQYWALLSWLIVMFKNAYRAVVVTDRRIVVFNTGKWSGANVKQVLRVLPRSTAIGPASGLWWRSETLGERLYIHKRFHKDIAEADAMRESGAPLPPPGS